MAITYTQYAMLLQPNSKPKSATTVPFQLRGMRIDEASAIVEAMTAKRPPANVS